MPFSSITRFVAAALLAASSAQDGSTRTETTPVVTESGYLVQASDTGSLTVVDEPRAGPVGVWIECAYFSVASVDAPVELVSRPVLARPGGVYTLWCWYEPEHAVVPGYPFIVQYDPIEPVPGLVDVVDVAEFARSQIELEPPVVELSPAATQVVGIDTWLAVVSELDYPDVTAQAGMAWATVRASLVDARWNLGDGTTVRCSDDIATTWDVGLGAADQTSACTHTYEQSSPEGGYEASVTVTWALEWINNQAPEPFVPWTTLSLTSPVSVQVEQLQAVIR